MIRTRSSLTRSAAAAVAAMTIIACSNDEPTTMPVAPSPPVTAQSDTSHAEFVVLPKDGTTSKFVASAIQALGAQLVDDSSTVAPAGRAMLARLTKADAARLQARGDIDFVAPNVKMQAMQSSQPAPAWGLDRMDQRDLPLNGRYTYRGGGRSTNIYIIDSGIDITHPDFGGRARVAYDAFGQNGRDCLGHGTHVAGTAAGTTYGVAKHASLWSVRVFDCAGYGDLYGFVNAVDWLIRNVRRPAVANMSLSFGGNVSAANTMVQRLINAGVFVSVSAGNSSADACLNSPASTPDATTVAAAGSDDALAWFTNLGACVDVFAPGLDIKSDWLNGTTKVLSGTSMAAPHVTGMAAMYKDYYGDHSQPTIDAFIKRNATGGKIRGDRRGAPNLLLFKPATM